MAMRKTGSGGFTLVEVLATMLIVSILAVAVSAALTTVMRGAGAAKDRSVAAEIAARHLDEEIATGNWQTGNSGDDAAYGDPKATARYHWSVASQGYEEPQGTADLFEVICTVTWKTQTGEQSLAVSTLMYDGAKQETTTGLTQ